MGHLLYYLIFIQPREGGREGQRRRGFPKAKGLDGNSANLALPTVLPGTGASEDDQGLQGEGLFLRSDDTGCELLGRKGEGARCFSLPFLESWPVSIYITQLNPQKQELGGRFFLSLFFFSLRHGNLYFLRTPQTGAVK